MQENDVVRIEITVRVPKDCSREDFKEWVEFNTNYSGCLGGENPLVDEPFEVNDIIF